MNVTTIKAKKIDSSKLTIISTIAALGAVLFTSLAQVTNGINYFIASETSYDIVRVGAIAILVSLLFIKAPRSMAMRLFLGLVASVMFFGSVWVLLNYQMLMIDTFVFMAVAIVFGVEALEPERLTLATYLAQTE
jgi:hypothetical protein